MDIDKDQFNPNKEFLPWGGNLDKKTTWSGDVELDFEVWFINIARFIKWEIFEQGSRQCQLVGVRRVSFFLFFFVIKNQIQLYELERLRYSTFWHYCAATDGVAELCDTFYWRKSSEQLPKGGRDSTDLKLRDRRVKSYQRYWNKDIKNKQDPSKTNSEKNWVWTRWPPVKKAKLEEYLQKDFGVPLAPEN